MCAIVDRGTTGKMLHALRVVLDVNQTEMGEIMRLHRSTIQNIESGKTSPTLEMLKPLENVGINAVDFLTCRYADIFSADEDKTRSAIDKLLSKNMDNTNG